MERMSNLRLDVMTRLMSNIGDTFLFLKQGDKDLEKYLKSANSKLRQRGVKDVDACLGLIKGRIIEKKIEMEIESYLFKQQGQLFVHNFDNVGLGKSIFVPKEFEGQIKKIFKLTC